LVKIVGFNESTGGDVPPMPMMLAKDGGYGMGGGVPEVQAGTLDIESVVAITFEFE